MSIILAAADPDSWTGVAQAFAEAFPGSTPHLIGYDAQMGRTSPEATWGFAPGYIESFKSYYFARNVHAPAWAGFRAGQTALASELVPEAVLRTTEYYNDWLRPQGDLCGGGVVMLSNGPDRLFMFGAYVERRSRARMEGPAMAAMQRLGPLMRHALDMNRMMLDLRLDAQALRDGVEPGGTALLVLSTTGAVIHANPLAEAMLAEGAVLRHDALGRAGFAEPGATDRLRFALTGPARGPLAIETGPMGARHEVRLLPVTPEAVANLRLSIFLQMRAPALLVAVRRVRAAFDAAAAVRRRLGLSPAEAEIALALADGLTPAEIAEARGASLHTVRNQLKAAMGKLGLRRQAELVALVGRARRPG